MTRRRSISVRLGAGIGLLVGSLLIAYAAPHDHDQVDHTITTTTRTTGGWP